MDRRQFIKKSCLFLTGTTLSGIQPVQAAPSLHLKNEVKIGVFAPSHCAAPLFFAKYKGYFKDAGVNVKVINYPSIAGIAKDIAENRLDLGQLVMPLNFAINTGVSPIKINEPLLVSMILGIHGSSLMTVNDAKIKTLDDFHGKRIVSTHEYAIHYLLTRYFLEKNGINIDTNVDLRAAKLSGFNNLILENKIDAFMMPEPVNALAEETGRVSLFMLNKYIWQYHPCCSLNIRQSVFNQDQQKIAAVISAVSRASTYINTTSNRPELIHVLRENSSEYHLVPQNVLAKAFSAERSGWAPFPYESSAVLIMKMMQDFKILPQFDSTILAKKLMQTNCMRHCLKDIGVRAPQSNSRPETILGKTFLYDSHL